MCLISLYYSSTYSYFGGSSDYDVGLQTEPLSEITRHLVNISDTNSVLSVSESPVKPFSTLLSNTPFVPDSEALYP